MSKLLHKLKIHKASGPDQVPARLLKTVADEIAPALSLLFKAALYQGKSPSDWNHALVTPIFKKGDRTQVVNYRPIFLTSIVSKCFEHIVHHHIMLHVDELGILHDAQHGFCRKRSCAESATVSDDVRTGTCVFAMSLTRWFDPSHRICVLAGFRRKRLALNQALTSLRQRVSCRLHNRSR